MPNPRPGDPAPDATVLAMDGQQRPLSGFWPAGPTVLVFIRHFGCLFCREQLEDLVAKRARLAGAQIVVVTMGTPEQTRIFMTKHKVPYEVICDPGQALYRAYGLKRTTAKEMTNPRLYLRAIAALLKGHIQTSSDQDTKQMPGVFVVNTAGQLTWAYRASHPGDQPSIDAIAAAVKDAVPVTTQRQS